MWPREARTGSRRPGTSRSSSPSRATRRPRASFRRPWRGTSTGGWGQGVGHLRAGHPAATVPAVDFTAERAAPTPPLGARERTGTVFVFPAPGVDPHARLAPSVRDRHGRRVRLRGRLLLMVLESACVPIPSEVTMLFGGALAAPGFAVPGEGALAVLGRHGRHHREPGGGRGSRTGPAPLADVRSSTGSAAIC